MVRYKSIEDYGPCPKCKSKKIRVENGTSTSVIITCEKCGLTLVGSNNEDAVKVWNKNKVSRLSYAVKNLSEQGNAYIGRFTKDIWSVKKKNPYERLQRYLSEETGLDIFIEDEGIMYGEGLIATAKKR